MTERNGVGEGRKRMGEEETEHIELKERDGYTIHQDKVWLKETGEKKGWNRQRKFS